MQIQCLEIGHLSEGLPGERGDLISIQTEFMQDLQVVEAGRIHRADGVVGEPQVPEIWEIVKRLIFYSTHRCFLHTQLHRVHGYVDWDVCRVRIVTQHCPVGERMQSSMRINLLYSDSEHILLNYFIFINISIILKQALRLSNLWRKMH